MLQNPVPKIYANGALVHNYEKENEEAHLSFKSLPSKMQESLYPYQKEGILFGIRNFGRVLVGD